MINKLLSCTFLICAAIAVHAQQKFTVNGILTESKSNRKVVLKYMSNGKLKTDTGEMKGGSFQFKGEVKYPVKAELYVLPPHGAEAEGRRTARVQVQVQEQESLVAFFVEQGAVELRAKRILKNALVKGGKAQQEYQLLQSQLKPLKDQLYQVSVKYWEIADKKFLAAEKQFGPVLTSDQNKAVRSAIFEDMPSDLPRLKQKIVKAEQEFIRKRPDSYVSFDLVQTYAKGAVMPATFDSISIMLSPRLRNMEETRRWSLSVLSKYVYTLGIDELRNAHHSLETKYKNTALEKMAMEVSSRIQQRLRALESTAVGQVAIPILKKDINGKGIDWESFKGKYLLLSFWGSWCGSCRESHPHLKELYSKYKGYGFDVLGIASESNENAWKNAIKKDGLPWNQVLNDLDKRTFDVAKSYGISDYPTKILIDKNGKIVGRYGDDTEDLDAKLKTAFGF